MAAVTVWTSGPLPLGTSVPKTYPAVMMWVPPDSDTEMFAELWLVGMVCVPKIGSGSKSGVITWVEPSGDAPSKNWTKPSGLSGKNSP